MPFFAKRKYKSWSTLIVGIVYAIACTNSSDFSTLDQYTKGKKRLADNRISIILPIDLHFKKKLSPVTQTCHVNSNMAMETIHELYQLEKKNGCMFSLTESRSN